jgi:hypothetical protein
MKAGGSAPGLMPRPTGLLCLPERARLTTEGRSWLSPCWAGASHVTCRGSRQVGLWMVVGESVSGVFVEQSLLHRASALYRRWAGVSLPCAVGAARVRICLRNCLRSAPRALFGPPPRRTTVRGRTLWTPCVAMNSLLLFRDQKRLWRPERWRLLGIHVVKTSHTAPYSTESLEARGTQCR